MLCVFWGGGGGCSAPNPPPELKPHIFLAQIRKPGLVFGQFSEIPCFVVDGGGQAVHFIASLQCRVTMAGFVFFRCNALWASGSRFLFFSAAMRSERRLTANKQSVKRFYMDVRTRPSHSGMFGKNRQTMPSSEPKPSKNNEKVRLYVRMMGGCAFGTGLAYMAFPRQEGLPGDI